MDTNAFFLRPDFLSGEEFKLQTKKTKKVLDVETGIAMITLLSMILLYCLWFLVLRLRAQIARSKSLSFV
jgi:hypothetical protein